LHHSPSRSTFGPALRFAVSALLMGCASSSKPPTAAPVEIDEHGEQPAAGATPRSSPLVRQAEELLAKGEAKAALAKFEQALAADPKDLRALLGAGLSHEALSDPKQAERAYRQAIEVDATFGEAHNNLGLVLRDRGDDAEAIREFELAAKSDARLASAQANLALALEESGRSDEAAKAYARAVTLAPKDALLRANHGLFLLAQNNEASALTELRAGLAAAQGDRAALLAIGNGLRRAGKPDEGVRALRAAIEAGDGKPTPALLSELALAQHAAGDTPGAKTSLAQALELDARYATAHYLLGSIEASGGNTRVARTHYERCIALEPNGPLAAKAKERLVALKAKKP
jgi:Tfp pilus assembly protein PilF